MPKVKKVKNKLGIFLIASLFISAPAVAADVVQRNTVSTNRATPLPSRAQAGTRAAAIKVAPVIEPPVVVEEEVAVQEIVSAIDIDERNALFESALGASGVIATDTAGDARAEMIRQQRAALDVADAIATTKQTTDTALAYGTNACDTALRACMRRECNNDFSKCAGDGDTAWGNKMNTCRRDTKCTAHEFAVFSKEIKADRDANYTLSAYQEVIDCGVEYNECIATKCVKIVGDVMTLDNCLGKAVADRAMADCMQTASKAVGKNCATIDSGITARTGQVFGTLRQGAEVKIAADEKRLYELRDQMRTQCKMLGAMFDERSLDCVYTVNFFADGSVDSSGNKIPYASKKLYAGSTFDCNPEYFGIDITTHRENAAQATRAATGASSAVLGAGLGVAVGAIASGAIDRAMDTQKAKTALSRAECEATGRNYSSFLGTCSCGTGYKWDKNAGQCVEKSDDDDDSGDNGDNSDNGTAGNAAGNNNATAANTAVSGQSNATKKKNIFQKVGGAAGSAWKGITGLFGGKKK